MSTRITDTPPTRDDTLFTPAQLAERWDTSAQTLANMRSKGVGPRYYKMFNGQIRYPEWSVFEAELGLKAE